MVLLNIPYNVFASSTFIENFLLNEEINSLQEIDDNTTDSNSIKDIDNNIVDSTSTEEINNTQYNEDYNKNDDDFYKDLSVDTNTEDNSTSIENFISENTDLNNSSSSIDFSKNKNCFNNKKNTISTIASNSATINFSPVNYASNFVGGDGTKDSPYQISTPEELSRISYLTNTLKIDTTDMYFELLNDIDLSNFDSDDDVSNGNWTPIGYNRVSSTRNNCYFSGNINGNGFTISNLSVYYSTFQNIGFIGVMDGGSVINLNLENIDIAGKRRSGGLIGEVYTVDSDKDIIIKDINVSGKITGDDRIGGLIGGCYTSSKAIGSISNCFTNVNITSNYSYDIGAFIGSTDNIRIIDSSCTGTIDLYSDVGDIGGFTGAYFAYDVSESYIKNCTSDVDIVMHKYDKSNIWIGGFIGYYDYGDGCEATGEYHYVLRNCSSKGILNYLVGDCVGGFVGWGNAGMINCSTTVTLIGNGETIGGFIGEVSDYIDGLTAINKCYSKNDIQGKINVGGFAGDVYAPDIINCYSMSNITCESDSGGFIGRVCTTFNDTYVQIIKNNYSASTIKTNYDWYVGLTDGFIYSFDCNRPYTFENNYYDGSIISDKCKNILDVKELKTEDMIGYNTYENMDLDYNNIWFAHKNSYPTFLQSNTAPELSGNDIKLILNQDYNLLDYINVEDFEDKDLVPKIITDLDITQIGDYTATFTVTDPKGLSDSLTLNIKVVMESPVINANDIEIFVNDEFDEKKGVTATDVDGTDITEHIKVIENTVNTKVTGEYKVIYEIKSLYKSPIQKEIKVAVKESPIINDGNDKDDNLNNPTTDKDNNNNNNNNNNSNKPSKPEDNKNNSNTNTNTNTNTNKIEKPQTSDNFTLYNILALVSSTILLCLNKKSKKQ